MEEVKPECTYSIISYPSSKLPLSYHSLIFTKWLHSFRFGNDNFSHVPSKTYYEHYHSFIEKLLAKPDSTVKLAVLSDDPDVVLGFAVCREDVLDYVYVNKENRSLGIATALVPKEINTVTHMTKQAMDYLVKSKKYEITTSKKPRALKKDCKNISFNPFV